MLGWPAIARQEITMTGWERVGGVPRARLIAARLQLHHAAQPAAAVGKLLLPHQEDYGEQSFRWDASARCLAQGPVAAATPFRAALRPAPPALQLLSAEQADHPRVLQELPLDGRTLEELYGWLAAQLEELLGRPLPGELERAAGLPAHPVAAGGRFDAGDDEAFAEVARLFADADRVLTAWASTWPGASAVRCWPHHFDIATLASLTPAISMDPMISMMEAAEPSTAAAMAEERGHAVGLGMVPGDEGRTEPYFYVTPSPYPERRELPPLPAGGTWNTEGWLGAVLAAPSFMDAGQGAAAQAEAVETFLRSAAEACRRLLATVPG
jgi:hypothetical protein